MSQRGFARESRLIEERHCAGAQSACFEVAAFAKKKKSLVQIQEPGPDEIFFARKHLASSRETLQRLHRFALLSIRHGFIGERLGGFIPHAEFFEAQKSLVSRFPRFFAQIQLEVDLRKVQVA